MWTINRIDEADFGCEERLPGEPLLVLVTIENDEDGRICTFEFPEDMLIKQNLNEGDEWPEDVEALEAKQEQINNMNEWIQGYYDAVAELEVTDS